MGGWPKIGCLGITNIMFVPLDKGMTAEKSNSTIRDRSLSRTKCAACARSHFVFGTNAFLSVLTVFLLAGRGHPQTQSPADSLRTVSGVVLTDKNEAVPDASITAKSLSGTAQALSDGNGNFHLRVSNGTLVLKITGKYLVPAERLLSVSEPWEGLVLQVKCTIPPVLSMEAEPNSEPSVLITSGIYRMATS